MRHAQTHFKTPSILRKTGTVTGNISLEAVLISTFNSPSINNFYWLVVASAGNNLVNNFQPSSFLVPLYTTMHLCIIYICIMYYMHLDLMPPAIVYHIAIWRRRGCRRLLLLVACLYCGVRGLWWCLAHSFRLGFIVPRFEDDKFELSLICVSIFRRQRLGSESHIVVAWCVC